MLARIRSHQSHRVSELFVICPYLQRQVVWVLIRELALAAYQFHRYFKIHFMFQFKVFLFLPKGFLSLG
ncbi:hypothetical protein CAB08_05445 [Vibrio cholerae]|nr:hypothetical protein [Vibrio cholerae]MCD1236876.1 hypothetical protein [Vibrio cholerae]